MLGLVPLLLTVLLITATYVIYQRFLHPLASFPGPVLASITDFWRFYHELRGDLPSVIHKYHQRYGSFIRVSPEEIDIDAADVIDVVYQKGGRHYLKSEFYNGLTAVRPNMFGTRDEDLHALRRRQMAHGFSQASLVKIEHIFNQHVTALLNRLDQRAKAGRSFDLGMLLRCFAQDCNGELSLGIQFGMQQSDDPDRLLPLNDHFALAKLTGFVPWLRKPLNMYGRYLPWLYLLQKLLALRAWLSGEAARVTALAFKAAGRENGEVREQEEATKVNLLTSLVVAKDPETGEYIERDDVVSNAFSYLVTGSHTTSATLEIMWWYLLHYPEMTEKAIAEIEAISKPPDSNTDLLPFAGLEAQLPTESDAFGGRLEMPTTIDGVVIPAGKVVSANVYSLHRNEAIWGADATDFRPDRWFDETSKKNVGFLMQFGAGHRACVGRNQALIMLWKVIVEVLRRFELVLASKRTVSLKEPEMRVTGFAEIAKPLIVIVRGR